jgi:sulfur-carrier protein adenylyltransferase/sulfurtransferase
MQRYERQMRLPEVGTAGQHKLRHAHVLLVGCGGLGAPAALYLAAAGVGRISVADDDSVALTNLHRQIAYSEADVGAPKVEALARELRARNHDVAVCTHVLRVTAASALTLGQGVDVVVDATDNVAARYVLSDACVALGVPLVHAAVHGFTGQIATLCLPLVAPDAADLPVNSTRGCYRCMHPAPPPDGLVPACDAGGLLGTTPGVLGVLLAQHTLLCLLTPPPASTLATLDLRNLRRGLHARLAESYAQPTQPRHRLRHPGP